MIYVLTRKAGLTKHREPHPAVRHPLNNVCYFYAKDKYALARTADGQDTFVFGLITDNGRTDNSNSLKQIDDLLKQWDHGHFTFCHRAYLVNMQYVTGVSGSTASNPSARHLILSNGLRVPLARRLTRQIKDSFFGSGREDTKSKIMTGIGCLAIAASAALPAKAAEKCNSAIAIDMKPTPLEVEAGLAIYGVAAFLGQPVVPMYYAQIPNNTKNKEACHEPSQTPSPDPTHAAQDASGVQDHCHSIAGGTRDCTPGRAG